MDFCSDPEIVDLAKQATTRLLTDWLRFVTDEGFYYPVAGRNRVGLYQPVHWFITYILTGRGIPPDNNSWRQVGYFAFAATSTFDFESVGANWEPVIDRTLTNGHPVNEHKTVHASLSRTDRTLVQWSAGAVFHPDTILDSLYTFTEIPTATLLPPGILVDIAVWFLNAMPGFLITTVARMLPGQTKGTDWSGATYHIYKHYNSVLTSLQDFNVGYRGQEQYPWVATAHDVPVFTQSGPQGDCVLSSNGEIRQTHLPLVQQDSNVALITYKPTFDVRAPFVLLGWAIGFSLRVALYFPVEKFDEVVERENWVIGRRVDSYVAVWRDDDTSQNTCDGSELPCDEYWFSEGDSSFKSSVWAVVVGDADTHGDFSSFVSTVEQGTVTRELPWLVLEFLGFKLTTEVNVDGKQIVSKI